MTDIYDRVERLKKDFLNPNTPDEKKSKILDYFKEYNEIFYGVIDIDSFSSFPFDKFILMVL